MEIDIFNPAINSWSARIGIFFLLIILGIVIGRMFSYGLSKLLGKIEAQKRVRQSFIMLFLVVLKWSVYILFIDFAILQLGVPQVTEIFGKVLLTLPAYVGAIILLVIGFAIATFLREVIEDSEVTGWKFVSQLIFYFSIFVFSIYAVKVAFIPLDLKVLDHIILILISVFSVAIAYYLVRKEFKSQNMGGR